MRNAAQPKIWSRSSGQSFLSLFCLGATGTRGSAQAWMPRSLVQALTGQQSAQFNLLISLPASLFPVLFNYAESVSFSISAKMSKGPSGQGKQDILGGPPRSLIPALEQEVRTSPSHPPASWLRGQGRKPWQLDRSSQRLTCTDPLSQQVHPGRGFFVFFFFLHRSTYMYKDTVRKSKRLETT